MTWLRIKHIYQSHRLASQVVGACLLSLIVISISLITAPREDLAGQRPTRDPDGIDTFVPKGAVYVPIDVQNIDSLDSVFGQYGLVDLYRGQGEKRNRLVASGIRMLRAPLNPRSFGVICQEDEKDLVVGDGSPFFVVLRNPDSVGTKFEKPLDQGKPRQLRPGKRTSRIQYLE